jgi:hypothetical protein
MSNEETQTAHDLSSNFHEMTPEQKQAFFAQIGLASPKINPNGYELFAFVVSNKVSVIFTASKENMQDYIEAMSSNPLIVKLTPEQKNLVAKGWNYNPENGGFSAPE